MVSSVLCRCVASPPPDAAAAASSASSPASVDPCGGAVCGGPDHRLRLWSLFQTLDVNRDGGLCVNDLAVGLRRLGLHRTEGELRNALVPVASVHTSPPPPISASADVSNDRVEIGGSLFDKGLLIMSHLMVNVIPEATQVERRKLGSGG
ncbi:Calcium-binding mitochondrial carrier protein SCaMC-2 [Myotis davidii]|uniref:Calcium-binding mitochondrial carrier protein SCaMC-2 n=1 Tax=Myotis davidii TaxID=225400 RepID=L5LKL1_MYODS|nr:Calcium-binding mitochondrial carrier protein SCaMC-2 [Myotis davidii]